MKSRQKNLIIIGSGDQAHIIADEVKRKKEFKVIGYIDEFKRKTKKNLNIKRIGGLKKLADIKKNFFCVIAIGQGNLRKNVVTKLSYLKIKVKWAKIISKNSIISPKVKIGEGSVIISGSVINSGTVIGKHCLINTGSKIDHDNFFDDYSSCGPSVTTGGNVKIGKYSHLGIGSTLKNNLTIEKSVVVGAGSLVIKNCKKNNVYFGNPVKKIRKLKKNENYLN